MVRDGERTKNAGLLFSLTSMDLTIHESHLINLQTLNFTVWQFNYK